MDKVKRVQLVDRIGGKSGGKVVWKCRCCIMFGAVMVATEQLLSRTSLFRVCHAV